MGFGSRETSTPVTVCLQLYPSGVTCDRMMVEYPAIPRPQNKATGGSPSKVPSRNQSEQRRPPTRMVKECCCRRSCQLRGRRIKRTPAPFSTFHLSHFWFEYEQRQVVAGYCHLRCLRQPPTPPPGARRKGLNRLSSLHSLTLASGNGRGTVSGAAPISWLVYMAMEF